MIYYREDRILVKLLGGSFKNQQDIADRPSLEEVTSPIKKPILILRPKEV